MRHSSRTFLIIVGSVTLIGLALRLIVSMQLLSAYSPVASPSPQTDMHQYQIFARQINDGTYDFSQGFYYQPFYYVVFLPAIYGAFGFQPVGLIVVQSILGAACIWLIGLVFAYVGGRRVGVAAAILAALARYHIFYTPFALIAVLQSFWLCLFLYCSVIALRRRHMGYVCLSGLVTGLAITTRGNILLFVPLILLLIVYCFRGHWRQRVVAVVLYMVCCYLPQLPFALVNYRAHGRLIGASSAADAVLALGNTPESPPGGREPGSGAGSMEYPESFRQWIQEAARSGDQRVSVLANTWRWIEREPAAYVELKWRMLLLFWNKAEIPNNVALTAFGRLVRAPLLHAVILLDFLVIGALGLAGIILGLATRRRRIAVLLSAGCAIVYCFSIVLFYVLARFRIPIVPLLCGFGGYALIWIWQRYRTYRSGSPVRPLIAGLTVVAASVVMVGWGFDIYRHGWERTVMRWVRPNGVRVPVGGGETLFKDHGPMSFGGWTPVPATVVQPVRKIFVIPDDFTAARQMRLRLLLGIRAAGAYVVVVSTDVGETVRVPLRLASGVHWVEAVLPDGYATSGRELTVTVSVQGASQAGGSDAAVPTGSTAYTDPYLFFDGQRDNGRTVLSTPLRTAAGELVIELWVVRE